MKAFYLSTKTVMKTTFIFFLLLVVTFLYQQVCAQNPVNWTKADLMEPSELASILATGKDLPVIFSVGPGATIPHSIHIGMTNNNINLGNLKKQLAELPKSSAVVIYCGCCPFEHCPNVRPAIAALQTMQFSNYKLLNLPKNLKADWIDKGYPVTKQ